MIETKTLTGKIIRILNNITVIINLGSKDGITNDSIFSIFGEPESITDPFTGENLGSIRVVKTKLKASQVYNKFTIATTRWTIQKFKPASMSTLLSAFANAYETEVIDNGDLRIDPKDVEPWKAQSETPVRIGDLAEVEIKSFAQEHLPLIEDHQENSEKEENLDETTKEGPNLEESI